MLFAVRKSISYIGIVFVASVSLLVARPLFQASAEGQPSAPPQQETSQSSSSPQQATPAPGASQAPATFVGPVIVLDPGHGGTDTGARGESGAVEKDVVLEFARAVRGDLEQQGYHVVMTRNDDSNPSYDDRAAIANAYRDALFITFHISSTGTVGTAHAYYYQFWSPIPVANAPAPSLTPWEEAQRPHAEASHRFADAIQAEFAQRFSSSPARSSGVAIRGLRSIDAPAVAVEISSVSVSDPISLTAMAAPLAASITHSVQAFHPAASIGTKQ